MKVAHNMSPAVEFRQAEIFDAKRGGDGTCCRDRHRPSAAEASNARYRAVEESVDRLSAYFQEARAP